MTQVDPPPDLHARTVASNRGRWLVVVPRRWKRVVLREFLQGADSIRFCTRLPSRQSYYQKADSLLVWGRQIHVPPKLLKRHPHLQVVTAEDGFISTRGLGLTGSFFYSLLLDKQGIHYDSGSACDLRDLLNNHPLSREDELLGKQLIELIRFGGLSKCNLSEQGEAQPLVAHGASECILAVGQLEHDKALAYSLSPIRTNLQLLQEVRSQNPCAWIVFKPHPIELRSGGFGRRKAEQYLRYCNQLAFEGSIEAWIDAVDSVHLISSTTGLEALIRGTPVYTYGTPIYAGWGLTHDWAAQPDRQRVLSLEQMISITHGIYPRYFNWASGRFESALETLECLLRLESGNQEAEFFKASLGKKQRRIQRWRNARLKLLKPMARWRMHRAGRVMRGALSVPSRRTLLEPDGCA